MTQPELDELANLTAELRSNCRGIGSANCVASSRSNQTVFPSLGTRSKSNPMSKPLGYKKLAVEERKQQDEVRAQRRKLKPEDIDKNCYRYPAVRKRAPRDVPQYCSACFLPTNGSKIFWQYFASLARSPIL